MPVDSNRMPIEIRNLTKTFGAVRALDGLELTVREGEVHGFLGPNGAGKSTTIRVLLGVVKADSGTARLLGGDPWADAVDLCVAQIHASGACTNFLAVNRVLQTDARQTDNGTDVVSSIEMVVVSPFTACSPIASSCTGTCWDLKSARPKSTPGSREQLRVGYRLRIEKSFAFQKNDDGWRCSTTTMEPSFACLVRPAI